MHLFNNGINTNMSVLLCESSQLAAILNDSDVSWNKDVKTTLLYVYCGTENLDMYQKFNLENIKCSVP